MIVEPTITGVSYRPMARYSVRPSPGHRKTVSVMIAPPTSADQGKCKIRDDGGQGGAQNVAAFHVTRRQALALAIST